MKKKIATLALFAILTLSIVATLTNVANALVASRTYTLDGDFDEGILVGVEHETVHDQLQLSKKVTTLPFIWVPNEEDTISKGDTRTGKELGRYMSGPIGFDGEPSRTTVDLQGNVWVANRYAGTLVKIGLYEAGSYIDRNGDGMIETSNDTNEDGDIAGSEMLPWGQDECVLFEVVLIPGKEGTYVPGNYTGGYTHDFSYPGVRSVAVDKSNNVWAGAYGSQKFYYINGTTGQILKIVDVSPWGHHPYGALMDANGVVWSSSSPNFWPYHVLRLDPRTDPPTISRINLDNQVYGLGLDYLGHLFVAGWGSSTLTRINTTAMTVDWVRWYSELYNARGVVCTSDNDVWVAVSGRNIVARFDNDGNLKATIPVGNQPSGVAVDSLGKVWACDLSDDYISRIDPATNTVDLSKRIIGSGGHYTYSDMTGIVSRTITTRIGTWTVIFDSEAADTPWGTISWTSYEPEGTSVTVKVRSSNDNITWSTWETAINGVPLSTTPNGRYLQIQTTLQITKGEVSPILYDLTVQTRLTPGKVTGGGQIEIPLPCFKTGKASFGFNIVYQEGDPAPTGELQYVDHTTKMIVHSHNMTSLVVSSDKTKATFTGECTINGIGGFTFKAYVEDNGEPGKNDIFKITLSDGYSAGGILLNGNIQIHKKP